jgi:hypothetical protein
MYMAEQRNQQKQSAEEKWEPTPMHSSQGKNQAS